MASFVSLYAKNDRGKCQAAPVHCRQSKKAGDRLSPQYRLHPERLLVLAALILPELTPVPVCQTKGPAHDCLPTE